MGENVCVSGISLVRLTEIVLRKEGHAVLEVKRVFDGPSVMERWQSCFGRHLHCCAVWTAVSVIHSTTN